MMEEQDKAIKMTEAALKEALKKIDDVDEEMFRDAKAVIELLKENITIWKEDDS